MKRKILMMLLILACVTFVFFGCVGTDDDDTTTTPTPTPPTTESKFVGYKAITSASQLQNMSLTGKYYLANDISLKDFEWTPIGDKNNPFSGELDGNGFAIYNFKYSGKNFQESLYSGLFGVLSGNVKNLDVIDYWVQNIEGEGYSGIIAGMSILNKNKERGIIENCNTYGSSTVYSDGSGYRYAGGIVGSNNSKIINCATFGVVISSHAFAESKSYAGGIAGENKGIITKSYSECEVSGRTMSGGVVGLNLGGINDCYSTGGVASLSIDESYVGGFAGYNSGTIKNCYTMSPVYAKELNASKISVGGFVGYNRSSASSIDGEIEKCFTLSKITTEIITPANVKIGGFYGYNGYYEIDMRNFYLQNNFKNTSGFTVNLHADSVMFELFMTNEFNKNTVFFDDKVWILANNCFPKLR